MNHFVVRKSALYLIWSLSVLILLIGCKKDESRQEAKQIIKEWVGKRIEFPKDIPCTVVGKEVASFQSQLLFDSDYKVLLFVDSAGCSDCRMRLFAWRHLIQEADSLFNGKLKFLFFFQPKKSNPKELEIIIRRNRFEYPVFVDVDNRLDSLNHFSKHVDYQCFLLNNNNEVLLVGNPLLSQPVWALFKNLISENEGKASSDKTTIESNKLIHDFGAIKTDKAYKSSFELKNTGNLPLVLYQVDASCGCTHVDWDKQPVKPGQSTKIAVEIKMDDAGYFNKTLEVFGNMEPSPLLLKITGTAIN